MQEQVSVAGTLRTALFVDFDNVFLSLSRMGVAAAEAFAAAPEQWMSWITGGMREPDSTGDRPQAERRILVSRCYLNPQAFGRYRAGFVRAGFAAVDCAALTQDWKNAADIVMTIDVLDCLRHPTHFDEFVILSGDSDFTPVLRGCPSSC